MKKPDKITTAGAIIPAEAGEAPNQSLPGLSEGEQTIAVVDNEGRLQGYTHAVVAPGHIQTSAMHNGVLFISGFCSFKQLPKPATVAPPGQEYVDPFLFETGHFESREEYEELSRTAKIKPRARA